MNAFQRVKDRFWFVPAVLCFAAFVVAEGLIRIDERRGVNGIPDWIDDLIYRVGESGSRDILGAIASSSLAVAGTTFSITMAVLALTSSSYGPRLVRNFMSDRGNQTVLGVYVATFLYSLMVLRSIRAIGDPGDPDAEVFVPHLAVNGAVVLGLANVVVLIYFIHHISSSIQISSIARRVRADLHRTIDRLYPATLGRGADEIDPGAEGLVAPGRADALDPLDELPEGLEDRAARLPAAGPGYVQYVRERQLFDAACAHDVLLAMRVRPGNYVVADQVLALVEPADRCSDELVAAVRDAVVVGNARSPYQDIEFAVQQLTELAVRALSPGTNDPYTAINALDDLSSGLSLLAERDIPSPARVDGRGVLRVHAPSVDIVELVSGVLDAVRWYGTDHPTVMRAALELIERVGTATEHRSVRARLVRHLDLLLEAMRRSGLQRYDVEHFEEDAARVRRLLAKVAPSAIETIGDEDGDGTVQGGEGSGAGDRAHDSTGDDGTASVEVSSAGDGEDEA